MGHVPTVLLTGASGFVGRYCAAALAARKVEVVAVTRGSTIPLPTKGRVVPCDLLDREAMRTLLRTVRPTHLLHCAWYVVPGRFWTSPDNLRWVEASIALFGAFGETGAGQRAVGVGTCFEYELGACDLVEAQTSLRPSTIYGRCKLATAQALAAAAQVHGFGWAWARLFTPYGPGEPDDKLLTAVAKGLLAGESVDVSEGTQERDFLYVEDVADALVSLLFSDVGGEVNIASGEARVLRSILSELEAIVAASGASPVGNIRFGARPRPAHDADRVVADVTRLRTELGWRPRVDLQDGLTRTVAALRDGLSHPRP